MPTFMRTVDKMPEDPTARVLINGLAVCCFSKLFNRAEIGFLQVDDHPLTLTIYDSECNPRFGTPIDLYSGTGLRINANNPGPGALYHPAPEGDDPVESDDLDFRHLINLDKLYREVFPLLPRIAVKPDFYLAKLYLSGGVFFNALRSVNPGTVINGAGSAVSAARRVGKVIGASLMDEEIVIDISSRPQPITLKRPDGRYTIIIRYKCQGRLSSESDFQEFHNVLDLHRNYKLDITFNPPEPPVILECERHLERLVADRKFTAEDVPESNLSRFLLTLRTSEEACQGSTKPECPTNLQGVPENCP